MGGIEAFKRKLEKLNIELPYDPAISCLGLYPEELKKTKQNIKQILVHDVNSSIIHIIPKVETTHISLS